ncbi:MAG: PQQ-dependent sugar dehydrogenase [Limisphaerales bacterium]
MRATVLVATLLTLPDVRALNLPAHTAPAGYTLVDALPGLVLSEPVAVVSPPGETNRLFIAERTGLVWAVTNLALPNKTLCADLRADLDLSFIEQGLLGLAFHPGFATNGQVFFTRTARTATTAGSQNAIQLLRLTIPPGAAAVDPASQTFIFAQPDFSNTHNGGDLHFGPDGYLYVSCGDELPAAKDITANRQPLDVGFFGGILRIDVDRRPGNLPANPHPAATANYLVPADNPFVGLTSYQGIVYDPAKVCTEFWAVGFRNPWRMSFDPPTGRLFAGEVGGGWVEEINLVERGENYGWPYLEGDYPNQPNLLATGFTSRPPLVSYDRLGVYLGAAVIGGVVYRGAEFPPLHGRYLFGDSRQGHIWAIDPDSPVQPPPMERLATDIGLSAFGRDPRDGGVLVVNFMDGRIKKLAYVSPADALDVPPTLAETGAFADLASLTPAAQLVPYAVNAPFWSDHAIKQRWLVPVPGQPVGFRTNENWHFPAGTAWVKHFDLELVKGDPASRRRLETRFLVKTDTGAYGVTYRWDDSQTNAVLVPTEGLDESFAVLEGGLIRTQQWRYPSRAECLFCHSEPAGYALGFSTRQLNHVNDLGGSPENQLARLHRFGCLDTPGGDPARLPALVAVTNTAAPLEQRARSYLDANCSSCHLPGYLAHSTAKWDARSATAFDATGLPTGHLLIPGDPTNSFLLQRVANSLWPHSVRMPPVGSTELDQAAVAMLSEWIAALPEAPWERLDLGTSGAAGSSTLDGGRLTLTGAGRLPAGLDDAGHFLLRPLPGTNATLTARLARCETAAAEAVAGLTFRQGTGPDDAQVTLGWRKHGSIVAILRRTPGGAAETRVLAGPGATRLRLVREGGLVRGFAAADGGAWLEVLHEPFPYAEPGQAGAMVAASTPDYPASFWLEEFQLEYPLPPAVPADVSTGIVDAASQGDGSEVYGTGGWWMPAISQSPPPEATLEIVRGSTFVWGFNSGDRRVLRIPGSIDRKPTTWFSNDELLLDLTFGDNEPHRVGLYFLDYDGGGRRAQTLEFLDPATGTVLESRELSNFGNGLWVVCDIQGAVRLRITNRSDFGNAVLSGIFVGPLRRPRLSVDVESPAAPVVVPLPGGLAFRAQVGGRNLVGVQVEFLVDGRRVAEAAEPPFEAVWRNPLAGPHELRARVTDSTGRTRLSDPVTFMVGLPVANVRLVGHDDLTLGDWPSSYGHELAWFPAGAPVGVTGVKLELGRAEVFSFGLTDDRRALAQGDVRPASCWFSATNMSFSVTTTDGRPRRVSLYCLDWDYAGREQRIEVIDPVTGAILDRRDVTHFSGGRYLTWEITGAVEFRVTARVGNAVVSGVFADPAPAAAEFLGADDMTRGDWRGILGSGGWSFAGLGESLPAGVSTSLRQGDYFAWTDNTGEPRAVAAADGSLRRPACWFDWNAVEMDLALPDTPQPLALYFLDWDNAGRVQTVELLEAASGRVLDRQRVADFAAGRWLKWRARGNLRVRIIPETSNAVLSGVALGEAADSFASLVRQDDTTRGNWPPAYGGRGVLLPFEPAFLPDGTKILVQHEGEFQWEEWPADVRAVLRPDSLLRRAACWKSDSTLAITADLTASGRRVVTLYLLDWDGQDQRPQTVTIVDADTGRLLDRVEVAAFSGGRHLSWLAGGRVRFELVPAVFNAVVSGIFLDLPDASTAAATFVREDDATRGDWPGTYGDDGVLLAGDAVRLPLGAAAEFRQAAPFVWHDAPADPRALWRDSSAGRVAACWYDWQAVTLDLTLPGDAPQPVALYFLDWDTADLRTGEVEVLDRLSGRLLDRRPLAAFSGGRYLAWNATGPLRFRVRADTANAVLSGVFFGIPPAAPEPEPDPGPGPGPRPLPLAPAGRLSVAVTDGAIQLAWPAGAGRTLETAVALEGPWSPVALPAAGTGDTGTLTLPGDEPARFYRLRDDGIR